MKLSLAVLLLIGENNAKHHHHHQEPVRPKKDISDKNIDPWVYSKVYNAVNPQPLERIGGPPDKNTYTPYGNEPYWPNKAEKTAVPAELQAAAKLAQMNGPNPAQKKDISDKKVDPWVFEKVYDVVNPMPLDRTKEKAPAKDTYTPNGNAPYWPTKEAPKENVPAELNPTAKPEAQPAKAEAPQVAKPAEAPKPAPPGVPSEILGTGAASLAQMGRNKRDISDKNIDPWVYDFAYDNVNPESLPRTGVAPKSDVYWKDIYAANKYGHKPTELEGSGGQKF